MDPISIGAIALGTLASTAAAASAGSSNTTIKAPDVPAQAAPQQDPGSKPKAKSSTPSFLSGPASLPQGSTASGGPQGKSLLGQ